MGNKVAFDEINKIINVTTVPVAGEVAIDVAIDLYSDGKEDWVANENLRKFNFPIRVTGGDPLPEDYLGSTFFLASDWKIRPYEASHRMTVSGNFYAEDGSDPFVDTIGDSIVRIMLVLSALVSKVETGVVTEQNKAEIVDGVWNEQTADHKEDGSYGAELATKADIAAASSTDSDAAGAGSVVYGTEDAGTYLSTNVKDNVYWQIEEDAADGLTVELTFNIPDENRAGVFRVFGRYEGTPSLSHYMGLWIYNYEASAWEQLIEEFLPGGNTSDAEYEHGYYERNIDRSNNNEVKVRLIHNVTTYNVNHHMFLDFAEVTSIDVITAADIASAVAEEDLSIHNTPNSMALAVRGGTYQIGSLIFDSVAGSAGTGWPIGTTYTPSNNLTDALLIMLYGKVKDLVLQSSLTIGASHDVSDKVIRTIGLMGTNVTLVSGCAANNTSFRNLDLSGVVTAGDVLLIYDCSIGTLENFRGVMNNVSFDQSAEISLSGWATIIQGTAGGDPTNEVEFSIGTASLNMTHWTGNLKLKDKTGTDRTVINCDSGNIIIDASCTAGTIQLLGTGNIEADNSGPGCNVDTDGFTTLDSIADAVWAVDDALFLLKVVKNKKALVKNGAVWQLIIYDDNDTTPILIKDLKDKDGNEITDLAAGVLAQELANSV